MKVYALLVIIVSLLVAHIGYAQPPVGWRGTGTGVFSDTSPPTTWSTDENVVWATRMPNRTNAQPVIVGDKVFTCSEPFDLLCLRLEDGELLWRRSNSYRDVTDDEQWKTVQAELAVASELRKRQVAIKAMLKEFEQRDSKTDREEARVTELRQQLEQLDEELKELPLASRYTLPVTQRQYNGYTTATPTSDGEYIWAVFGNRVVVCYDMKGERQWSRVLTDHPQSMWGHSSSPLLVGDKLIVNIDSIVGLDAKTGKQVWRTKYGQSWGSAVHGRIGNVDVALLPNGRILRVSDGTVLDRVPTTLENTSPVVSEGIAYYISVNAMAYPFPSELDDELALTAKWKTLRIGSRFYASAVIRDGLIYAVSTNHVLNVLDAANGQTIYKKRLQLGREPVWASLCVAGNYLYVSSRDGTTLVIETGRRYKELSRNTLDYFISTPVFHENRMYVRTSERLYCIGEP